MHEGQEQGLDPEGAKSNIRAKQRRGRSLSFVTIIPKLIKKEESTDEEAQVKENWFLKNQFICVAQNFTHKSNVKYSIRRITDFENLEEIELKMQKAQSITLEVGNAN